MASDRLFLDASFVIARFNPRDEYHQAARILAGQIRDCRELWTTEAILLEIGAAFAGPTQRRIVVHLWDQFQTDPRCQLASISDGLLEQAMELFRRRADKAWSLADCASFALMSARRLTDALTCDQHFVQAGFRALLLDARE